MKKDIKKFFEKYSIKRLLQLCLFILGIYTIIDMFNFPTLLLEKYNVYIILLIIIIVLSILNRKIIDLMKLNVTSYIDFVILSITLSTTMYLLLNYCCIYSKFKAIILTIVFIISIVCIIYRLIKLYKKDICEEEKETNVYDIKQLYKNEITNENKEIIFLEENDVQYDLLNRQSIITELYNSIYYCRNTRRFVISLTGIWGSGKTTIINIVKNKLPNDRFIIIDDFDAWKYSNEKALFYGMFDEIMSKIGIKFSLLEMRKFVNTCLNMITSNSGIDINSFNSDEESIKSIKDIINDYLCTNNKRVVFFIDNLERTNDFNILMILKTISTILNLDRFIYVLSYDEEEIKNIFEEKLNINYDYMEKVIQLPLKVPEISKVDINRICSICIKNLLMHYGIEQEEIEEYDSAVKLFIENVKDLRSFKRKVNSIFNSNFYNNNNYLNVIDSFLLELIHEENIKLYNEIKVNYKYFVSKDQVAVYGYSFEDAKTYNRNATEYFDILFEDSKNKKFEKILRKMFPNVEKYFSSYRSNGDSIKFWNESSYLIFNDKEEYRESIINRRIYNAKFFQLYFTKQENEFINIDDKVKELVEWLNIEKISLDNINKISELQNRISKTLYMYGGIAQKYILETMELYIKNIKNNKLIFLICLSSIQQYLDNTMIFLGINACERLEIICAELIKVLTEEDIKKLKKIIEIDYKNMNFIRKILYWLDPKDKVDISELDQNLYNTINESYQKLLNNVVENDINIYDKKFYRRYNIYCLIKDEKYKEIIKYINKDSIFRFLADMISTSCGTAGYGYCINIEVFNKCTTYDEIDKIIEKIEYSKLSEIEKFIIEIYNKSKEGAEESGLKEKTIYKESYIDIEKFLIS